MVQMAAIFDVGMALGEKESRSWSMPDSHAALLSPERERFSDLSETELLEAAASARRQTSWAQARELAAIAELYHRRRRAEDDDQSGGQGDRDPRVLSAHESVVEEVAAALTITGNAAGTLVHLADRLSTDLAGTGEALEAGRIDLPRARVICDVTDGLPEGLAERLEAAVLDAAPSQTTGQLRRRLKRITHRLAPDQVDDRKQQAVQRRRLELWETAAGTCDLALLDLAPQDAHAIYNKITAAARALIADGDTRPLNTVRADLARELLNGARLPDAIRAQLQAAAAETEAEVSAPDPRPCAQGSPTVAPGPAFSAAHQVPPLSSTPAVSDGEPLADPGIMAAPVRPASLDERVATPGDEVVIAVVAGIIEQRLTAIRDHVRAVGRMEALPRLSARAVQDVHDALVELRDTRCQTAQAIHNAEATDAATGAHGRPSYRPPAQLRRLIQERHPTCVFPTCNIRSSHCDLDHTTPYGKGTTCACNLAPLCRRHHRTKQTSGWTLHQPWPGLLVWTTPTGTWHINRPDRQ
ncbi:DUF222 domain-containing protein [Actinomadura sp. 9N407]|uniref:HNH endonuclease signature motif containing protein n=1 Tax=Actinomadura sp. 9N407 TaxID=3375154 RepID=UPI0037AEFCE6